MFDVTKPPEATGLRRTIFELGVGISMQHCMYEIEKALVGHLCRAMIYRLALELAPREGQFFAGGEIHAENANA